MSSFTIESDYHKNFEEVWPNLHLQSLFDTLVTKNDFALGFIGIQLGVV